MEKKDVTILQRHNVNVVLREKLILSLFCTIFMLQCNVFLNFTSKQAWFPLDGKKRVDKKEDGMIQCLLFLPVLFFLSSALFLFLFYFVIKELLSILNQCFFSRVIKSQQKISKLDRCSILFKNYNFCTPHVF